MRGSDSSFIRWAALILGLGLTAFGLFGVVAYVVGSIGTLTDGSADDSWLFWGLPLGLFGMVFLAGGVALLVLWRKLRIDDANRP